jgi:glycosyltransferase involved in cell wall biosynthesis
MSDGQRVVVVMPAYNAARTLERTYHDIPAGIVDHVILVDDVSQDSTVEVAQRLDIQVVVHVQNRGYGGNQKTCYLEALKAGADIIVMLHPDYQYDSTLIPDLIAPIQVGTHDMVLGSRLLAPDGQRGIAPALRGGMPWWKIISNRFLTICENTVLEQSLSECHTGFRAYSRRLIETVPFLLNSDDFVFDTEMIVQAVAAGFRIGEISVPTRYFEEASSVNFQRSVVYGMATLHVLRRYMLHRAGIRQYPQFSRQLRDVVSPYHREHIFATSPQPQPRPDETPTVTRS